MMRHNEGYYQDKWSVRGIPWELFLNIECEHIHQARALEGHIKRMKSKKYIENLKRYPEIIEKLKIRYRGESPDNPYPDSYRDRFEP